MIGFPRATRLISLCLVMLFATTSSIPSAFAQPQDQAPPPSYSPDQLDRMVSRIALYPDPLLAQSFLRQRFPSRSRKPPLGPISTTT
jgi:hypothetical protein